LYSTGSVGNFGSGKPWEGAFRYPELGFEMETRPKFEIFVRLFAFGLLVRAACRLGAQLHVYRDDKRE
jgi:hypothetical protein